VALYGVATLADRVRASMGPQVAVRRILSTLGGIAIVLTLVGVYGVIAHMVGLRTREMGLRMAVGVHPPRCARSCWATPLASPDGGSSWAWARA
jgi:hypothetical protein